ncbi:hypothetical protein [Mucilaginibacter psychrotolerans]|uniref:Tail fiber protein n=1 Tax=Mucilaginibacter psychrotolerans TaxID=1524096 RepID=A0A4Y8S367_9SPHI|nr:hypothetical protein [Mucilaginibacter psychrotolerans]TFF33438.1 hypothetical protein E2R66_25855 [Mucilaginibacter psychrotolerans]
MKKIILAVSVLGLILTAYAFTQRNESPASGLGDVKYSILPPDQFQKLNGDGWILADGRAIKGSKLHLFAGIINAPDARGMFLRGLNYGRNDDKIKPDGRQAGQYQPDTVGPHSHGWTGEAGYLGGYGYPDNAERRWTADGLKAHPKEHNEKNRYVAAAQKDYAVFGVGTETRPKNIAMYIYIKIN